MDEWINFHKLVGVEHFYLINHNSTDDFREILQPYIDEGLVSLYEAIFIEKDLYAKREWINTQTGNYIHIIDLAKKETEWLAIIDLDEFIMPKEERDLRKWLRSYPNEVGIQLNWKMFGLTLDYDLPKNQLLMECALYRAPDEYRYHWHVKSIVRPEEVTGFLSVHRCTYKHDQLAIDLRRKPQPIPPKTAPTPITSTELIFEPVCIHHYWFRTPRFFMETKIPRSRANGHGAYLLRDVAKKIQITRSCYDPSALPFVNKVKSQVRHYRNLRSAR